MTSRSRTIEPSLDALLAQALRVFDADPVGARLRLAAALNRGVDREMITAALAKSVAVDDPESALDLLKSAIDQAPQSLALWSQYWQVLAHDIESGSDVLGQEDWQTTLKHRLAWINQGAELRAILKLLDVVDAQTNALVSTPRYLGYCRWDARNEVIQGWALDRWSIQEACSITIEGSFEASCSNTSRNHRITSGQLRADSPRQWLAQAGISGVGGFVIRVPANKDPMLIRPLSLHHANGQPLVGSPLACGTAIEVQVDNAVDVKVTTQVTKPSPTVSDTSPLTNQPLVVDVLVAVYEGREHVLACIKSLLNTRHQQTTAHEIVVLDDASQDPVLVKVLQDLAETGEIVLVRREANLGFIRNINRGMALHADRDVVWLNADTRVTGNWLDRLRSAAYATDNTASATPWSNDGEFMTLAGKSNPEPMPSQEAQQQIDFIVSELNLPPQELVSGCGFCFYVKRKAINQVGYLDETHLIDGYGEETDWCLRARQLGWRHVAATNLFVGHAGGQSFGTRKKALAHHNNAVIRQRYPMAERLHDDYLHQDPLKPARHQIARARFESREQIKNPTLSIQCEVSVAQNKRPQKSRSYPTATSANDIQLTWQIMGTDTAVTLKFIHTQPALQLDYRLPQDTDQLAVDLTNLVNRPLNPKQDQAILVGNTHHVPTVLTRVLQETLGGIQSDNKTQDKSANAKSAKAHSAKFHLAKKQDGPDNLPTSDGLALIVDDLQDADVVDVWLKAIRAAEVVSDGIRFITTQNTPGAQLLRRTGQVAPMFCPGGLTWKHWLRLLNVNCAVSLMPATAFIDNIMKELDLDLPLVDRHALIPTHHRETVPA